MNDANKLSFEIDKFNFSWTEVVVLADFLFISGVPSFNLAKHFCTTTFVLLLLYNQANFKIRLYSLEDINDIYINTDDIDIAFLVKIK